MFVSPIQLSDLVQWALGSVLLGDERPARRKCRLGAHSESAEEVLWVEFCRAVSPVLAQAGRVRMDGAGWRSTLRYIQNTIVEMRGDPWRQARPAR